jgi:hypothetical protein
VRKTCLVLTAMLVLVPALAGADSISPTAFTGTLSVGGSITITKTVTVSAGTPTTAQGDVFFLSDTTGSMGGTIADVKTNASAILSGLSVYGNIQTGAGNYRDVPTSPWGQAGTDYAYKRDSAIDGATTTQAALNTWATGNGLDSWESQLIALSTVATDAATGWRAGSEKFVLWFGDYAGHEPSNTPGYPGPSTADTIAALQAAGVTVLAFNVGAGYLDYYGQATAITSGTGGTLYAGYGSNIVDTIVDAIGSAFDTYSMVDIEAPSLAGLGISITPLSYMASYDRSAERTFTFDVTFTGLTPGTYYFDMFGRVDGGRVATESDVITVTVPDPGSSLLLLSIGVLGLAGFRRRR